MQIFQLDQLSSESATLDQQYHEFLRARDLSMGLYRLKRGQNDPQSPHNQDEIYFVTQGKARMQVSGEIQDVSAGSIVYVPANADHKFVDILEDIETLVFFAPAEN